VLGTPHINLNTAFQRPMSKVFNIDSSGAWTYSATASTVLMTTTLLAQGESGTQAVRFAPAMGNETLAVKRDED
jgi:hypothetical protein